MAIRRAPARQVEADRGDEDSQQHQGAERAPPGRSRWQQGDGDRDLCERQQDGNRGRQPGRDPEFRGGPAGTGKVGELGDAGDREYRGEDKASEEKKEIHLKRLLIRNSGNECAYPISVDAALAAADGGRRAALRHIGPRPIDAYCSSEFRMMRQWFSRP